MEYAVTKFYLLLFLCVRLRRRRSSGNDGRGNDSIELREARLKIRVALRLDPSLIGTAAARGAFTIPGVEAINHVHSFDNLADGRESLGIESGVVPEVDKELRGPGVWTSGGKGHPAAFIRLRNGVVWIVCLHPCARHSGIARDAELGHEAGQDAEKRHVFKESGADKIVEPVRSTRRPAAMHFNDEIALGGRELRSESFRRFRRERPGIQQIRLRRRGFFLRECCGTY